eukprot:RCo031869
MSFRSSLARLRTEPLSSSSVFPGGLTAARELSPGSSSSVSGGGGSGRSLRKAESFGHRPRLLVCYICGQEFGTASLVIHTRQCYKKAVATAMKLPAKTRPALPIDPSQLTKDEIHAMCTHASGGHSAYDEPLEWSPPEVCARDSLC